MARLLLLCAAAAAGAAAAATATARLVCTERNDVFLSLAAAPPPAPVSVVRYEDLPSALAAAVAGDAVLLLADGPTAPANGTSLTAAQYDMLAVAGVSLYAEMPQALPGWCAPAAAPPFAPGSLDPRARLVVAGAAVAGNTSLRPLGVLQANALFSQRYAGPCVGAVWLHAAVVAGSSTAAYGLPPANETSPALFRVTAAPGTASAPALAVLVAALPLSNMITGRYGPAPAWRDLWSALLGALLPALDDPAPFPSWLPAVHPTASTHEAGAARAALAARATSGDAPARAALAALERAALVRATDWLASGSGLLAAGNATCQAQYWTPAADAPPLVCVLEGFASPIAPDGSQAVAPDLRADCNAEAAMALAARAWVDGASGAHAATAGALLNFTFLFSAAQQGAVRNNDSADGNGIIAWQAAPDAGPLGATFGDDNARIVLAAVLAVSLLRAQPAWREDTRAWERGVVKSVLANYRITSPAGFTWGRINTDDFSSRGWRYWYESNWTYTTDPIWPQPHYQSARHAMLLWAFAATGWAPLYLKAEAALASTLEAYPLQWETTEYMSEEQARLILPLAWLCRADAQLLAASSPPPSPSARLCFRMGACALHSPAVHQQWLDMIVRDYTARQNAFGGVQEALGNQSNADFPAPASNSAYGTDEAPLTQSNNDTITDQLYSNNFALLSLTEAGAVAGGAGSAAARAASDALAAYLTGIQATSTVHSRYDGAWLRSFDYAWWDYWGAAADRGWGPWAMETGWGTTWISAALALRQRNTSYWDVARAGTGVDAALLARWCPVFLGSEAPALCASHTFEA